MRFPQQTGETTDTELEQDLQSAYDQWRDGYAAEIGARFHIPIAKRPHIDHGKPLVFSKVSCLSPLKSSKKFKTVAEALYSVKSQLQALAYLFECLAVLPK